MTRSTGRSSAYVQPPEKNEATGRFLPFKGLLLGVVVAVIAVLLSTSAPTAAQTPPPGSQSVTVSPPTLELNGAPGQTLREKVAIDNGSNTSRTFSVIVQNFTAQGESGGSDLSDDESPYAMAKWVKVTPQRVTIKPQERREFDLQITIPNNPPPGGHFGAIIFEPANAGDAANVQVVSRVTALVLLRTPGDVVEKASIASFSAAKDKAPTDPSGLPKASKFFQRGPVDYSVRVRNEGNVQLKPQMEVEVRNIFGRKIETLRPEPRNVLPESVRRFDVRWDHKHLFGLYKAKTTVRYGDAAAPQTLTANSSFWAAPLWALPIIFIVLGLLILVIAVGVISRKRLKVAFKAFTSGGVPPATEPAKTKVKNDEDDEPLSRRFADDDADAAFPAWNKQPSEPAAPKAPEPKPTPEPEPTYGDPPQPNRRFADEGPPQGEERRGRRFADEGPPEGEEDRRGGRFK